MDNRKMIYLNDTINALERKKDKKAKGDIGGFYNTIIQNDIDTLMQLSPAQPKRKMGRWITKLENNTYECSECGNRIITNKDYLKKHKFCFCCGAKLRGEQDE